MSALSVTLVPRAGAVQTEPCQIYKEEIGQHFATHGSFIRTKKTIRRFIVVIFYEIDSSVTYSALFSHHINVHAPISMSMPYGK